MAVPEWVPTVDISETEAEYAIHAELPGVKMEAVKVTMETASSPFRASEDKSRPEVGDGIIESNGCTAGLREPSRSQTLSIRAR